MSCGALPPQGSDLPESLRTEQQMRPPLPAGTPIWLRHDPYWQPPSMFIAALLQPVGRWVEVDPDAKGEGKG